MVEPILIEKPFIVTGGRLSECPTYDYRNDTLYWIDIQQKRVYWSNSLNPSSAEPSSFFSYITASDVIGVLGLTKTPGVLVVGAKRGFAKLDLRNVKANSSDNVDVVGEIVQLEYICVVHDHEKDDSSSKMRFNDGSVDSEGRFFAGTMVDAGHKLGPIGNLYCLSATNDDSKYSCSVSVPNVTIPNGLGWSPDNKTMYFTDSPTSTISQFDYDAETGKISNRRTFVKVEVEGMTAPEPDGLTVARDGTVWGVIWGSHRLRRYSPDGTILQEYQFPTAERITCCTFAGPKLDKLIVTTASQRLAQDGPEADSKPLDDGGSLFVVDTKEELGMKKNIFKEI